MNWNDFSNWIYSPFLSNASIFIAIAIFPYDFPLMQYLWIFSFLSYYEYRYCYYFPLILYICWISYSWLLIVFGYRKLRRNFGQISSEWLYLWDRYYNWWCMGYPFWLHLIVKVDVYYAQKAMNRIWVKWYSVMNMWIDTNDLVFIWLES